VPEERESLLLLVCAKEHKTRENVFIVTGWESEWVGSRAQMILDSRAQFMDLPMNVHIATNSGGCNA